MDHPMIRRPKTALAVTDVYILNKREEESLCTKLDGMHYQYHAGLIRLKQDIGQIERQRQDFLTQRAVTPQSTLENIMNEIQTFKRNKHGSERILGNIPTSTEISVGVPNMYSKWPPSSFVSQYMPTSSKNKMSSLTEKERTQPIRNVSETNSQGLKSSERYISRKKRPKSSLPPKSSSSTELLTYKELGGIARLENISIREAEKQKQQQLLERQRLTRLCNTAIRQKVDHFLMKLESR